METRKQFHTKFVWDHGGSEVRLSINGGEAVLLQKVEDGTFEITTSLGQGRYEYCFSVDGVWTHDPDLPTIKNDQGHYNNLLKIVDAKDIVANKAAKVENVETASKLGVQNFVEKCFSDATIHETLQREKLYTSAAYSSSESYNSCDDDSDNCDDFPDLDDALDLENPIFITESPLPPRSPNINRKPPEIHNIPRRHDTFQTVSNASFTEEVLFVVDQKNTEEVNISPVIGNGEYSSSSSSVTPMREFNPVITAKTETSHAPVKNIETVVTYEDEHAKYYEAENDFIEISNSPTMQSKDSMKYEIQAEDSTKSRIEPISKEKTEQTETSHTDTNPQMTTATATTLMTEGAVIPSKAAIIMTPSISEVTMSPSIAEVTTKPSKAEVTVIASKAAVAITSSIADVTMPASKNSVTMTPSEHEIIISANKAEVTLTPSKSEVIMTPSKAEVIMAPSTVGITMTSSEAEVNSIPSKAEVIMTLSKAEGFITPSKSEVTTTQTKAEVTTVPSKPEVTINPSKAEVTTHPSKAKVTITPSKAEVTMISSKAEVPRIPSKAEVTITQSKTEVAKTPSKAEVITVSSQAKVSTVPSKPEVIIAPSKAEVTTNLSKAKVIITPSKAEVTMTSSKAEVSTIPSKAEVTITPYKTEVAKTPSKAEVTMTSFNSEVVKILSNAEVTITPSKSEVTTAPSKAEVPITQPKAEVTIIRSKTVVTLTPSPANTAVPPSITQAGIIPSTAEAKTVSSHNVSSKDSVNIQACLSLTSGNSVNNVIDQDKHKAISAPLHEQQENVTTNTQGNIHTDVVVTHQKQQQDSHNNIFATDKSVQKESISKMSDIKSELRNVETSQNKTKAEANHECEIRNDGNASVSKSLTSASQNIASQNQTPNEAKNSQMEIKMEMNSHEDFLVQKKETKSNTQQQTINPNNVLKINPLEVKIDSDAIPRLSDSETNLDTKSFDENNLENITEKYVILSDKSCPTSLEGAPVLQNRDMEDKSSKNVAVTYEVKNPTGSASESLRQVNVTNELTKQTENNLDAQTAELKDSKMCIEGMIDSNVNQIVSYPVKNKCDKQDNSIAKQFYALYGQAKTSVPNDDKEEVNDSKNVLIKQDIDHIQTPTEENLSNSIPHKNVVSISPKSEYNPIVVFKEGSPTKQAFKAMCTSTEMPAVTMIADKESDRTTNVQQLDYKATEKENIATEKNESNTSTSTEHEETELCTSNRDSICSSDSKSIDAPTNGITNFLKKGAKLTKNLIKGATQTKEKILKVSNKQKVEYDKEPEEISEDHSITDQSYLQSVTDNAVLNDKEHPDLEKDIDSKHEVNDLPTMGAIQTNKQILTTSNNEKQVEKSAVDITSDQSPLQSVSDDFALKKKVHTDLETQIDSNHETASLPDELNDTIAYKQSINNIDAVSEGKETIAIVTEDESRSLLNTKVTSSKEQPAHISDESASESNKCDVKGTNDVSQSTTDTLLSNNTYDNQKKIAGISVNEKNDNNNERHVDIKPKDNSVTDPSSISESASKPQDLQNHISIPNEGSRKEKEIQSKSILKKETHIKPKFTNIAKIESVPVAKIKTDNTSLESKEGVIQLQNKTSNHKFDTVHPVNATEELLLKQKEGTNELSCSASSHDMFSQINSTLINIKKSKSNVELHLHELAKSSSNINIKAEEQAKGSKKVTFKEPEEEKVIFKEPEEMVVIIKEPEPEELVNMNKNLIVAAPPLVKEPPPKPPMPVDNPIAKKREEDKERLERLRMSKKLDAVFGMIRAEPVEEIKTEIKIRGMGDVSLQNKGVMKKPKVEHNKLDPYEQRRVARSQIAMPEKPATYKKPKPKPPPKEPTPPPKEPTPPPKEPTPPPKEPTPSPKEPTPPPEPKIVEKPKPKKSCFVFIPKPPSPPTSSEPTPRPRTPDLQSKFWPTPKLPTPEPRPDSPLLTNKETQKVEATEKTKLKLGINGFDRMGRLAFRAALEAGLEVVAVNDPFIPLHYMVYSLKFDLAHCPKQQKQPMDVRESTQGGQIMVNGKSVQVYTEMDPRRIPWHMCGVNYVIEATESLNSKVDGKLHLFGNEGGVSMKDVINRQGNNVVNTVQETKEETKGDNKGNSKEDNKAEQTGNIYTTEKKSLSDSCGVKKVVVACNSPDTINIGIGINEDRLRPDVSVIGCISAPTNAILLVLKVILDKFKIRFCAYTFIKAILNVSR